MFRGNVGEYGLVEPEKLEEALKIQNKTGEKLGKVLKGHNSG